MANQRIAPAFPFPVYVNETATAQRLVPGEYVNETSPPPAPNNPGQWLIMFYP